MPYRRLTCYFLSGTGNSFRAARWLADAARESGTESTVIPIDRAAPRTELQAGEQQLVAIYHPSHGLMPPWSMIKFLLRLPRGRGAHAVVVATRGGIPIGKLVLPGAAGLALLFPLLVLALKGFRVRGGLTTPGRARRSGRDQRHQSQDGQGPWQLHSIRTAQSCGLDVRVSHRAPVKGNIVCAPAPWRPPRSSSRRSGCESGVPSKAR
jgi:hypothetical protein